MKYLFLHLIIPCLGLFPLSAPAVGVLQKAAVNIIPQPMSVKVKAGQFLIIPSTKVFVRGENAKLHQIAADMIERIGAVSNFELSLEENQVVAHSSIVLWLDASNPELTPEGYSLSISSRKVEIRAAAPAGIFYGLQSLYQLFPLSFFDEKSRADLWELPALEIVDKPRFKWRGNLLDASRHFLTVAQIKRNLDRLARLKINRFHWHLTDDQGWRIEIKSLPKLTEIGAWRVDRNSEKWWGRAPQQKGEKATYGGFYTQDQIREVIAYAEARFITVIPEIDMPGHSQAALAAYPEVSCDGRRYFVATGGVKGDNALCPGKEKTFAFVEKVIGEVASLFPATYIHIGGDECNKSAWKRDPDCRRRMRENGLKNVNELQSYFIKRVEKIVAANGKKIIGWDEILEGGLAPNATVMSWRGEKGGLQAARAGHDVIMTPNTYCYLDLKQGDPQLEPDLGYSRLHLAKAYSYKPVPKQLSAAQARHILGIQGNLWGESIQRESQLTYMLYPRIFAIAEVAWSPEKLRDFPGFCLRVEHAFKRLDILGVKYAPSMYNVAVKSRKVKGKRGRHVSLKAEYTSSGIRFTINGDAPTAASPIYKKAFGITRTSTIRAAVFKDGKRVGRVTTKTIWIK